MLIRPGISVSYAVLFLACMSLPSGAVITGAQAQTLKAGADLSQASGRAAAGATLRLGAGTYPGTIIVKGKTLTVLGVKGGANGGGTVLVGGKNQMLAHVSAKGKLVLRNVTFRPRPKDGFAVYAKDGDVTVSDCVVERSAQAAFYATASALSLSNCSLDKLAADGIVGTNGSRVTVSGITLTGAAKTGLLVTGKSTATLSGSKFSGFGATGAFASDASSLTVSKSSFTKAAGRGLAVQKGGVLSLTDVIAADLAGSAILGFDGTSVTVKGGSFQNIKRNALHFQGGKSLRVDGARFASNPQSIVVLGRNAKPAVVLRGNTVIDTPADKAAIVIQAPGATTLVGNTVIGDGSALSLKSAGVPVGIDGNLFVSRAAHAVSSAGGKPSLTGNRIVSGTKLGVLLNDASQGTLENNIVLSGGDAPVWVQRGATVRTGGNVFAGNARAIVYGKKVGTGGRVGDDLNISGLVAKPPAAGKPADAPPPAGSTLAQARSALALALAATPENVSALDAPLAGLTAARDQLVAKLRVRARVALQAEDRFGKVFPSGFVIEDEAGKTIVDVAAGKGPARVDPGTYRLVPDFDRRLARRITLEASSDRKIPVRSKAGVAFDVGMYSARVRETLAVPVLLQIKKPARVDKKTVLRRPPWLGSPRAGVTADEIAAAISLARKNIGGIADQLSKISKEYSAGPFTTARVKSIEVRRKRWSNAFRYAQSILAHYGGASDVDFLIGQLPKREHYRSEMIHVAAQIENRLGRLRNGRVRALLEDADKSIAIEAALVLRSYGHAEGDAVLNGMAADMSKPAFKYRIFDTARDRRDPALAGAARKTIDRYHADLKTRAAAAKDDTARRQSRYQGRWIVAARNAAQYLVLHGDPKDLRLAASVPLTEAGLTDLAPLLADPTIAVDVRQGALHPNGYQWNVRDYLLVQYCGVMDRMDARTATAFDRQIEKAEMRGAIAVKLVPYGDRRAALAGRWVYRSSMSRCRPSRDIGSFMFKRSTNFLGNVTWFRKPWMEAAAIDKFRKGDAKQSAIVQHMDHASLRAELAPAKRTPELIHPDLFLAWHKLVQDVCAPESCVFALTERNDPPGVLSGRLKVVPALVENRLRLDVNFDLGVFQESSLATMIANSKKSIDSYTRDGGRPLIKQLRLYRAGQEIAISEVRDAVDRGITYEADLGRGDLRGLTLQVDLAMFSATATLHLPLYMAEKTFALNRAGLRAAAQAEAVKKMPERALAHLRLGRVYDEMGRLADADRAFRKFAALNDKTPQVWTGIGAMYQRAGLYDKALAAYGDGIERHPKNVSLVVRKGNLEYLSGQYAAAAKTFGTASTAASRNKARWDWWRATNLLLSGDATGASALLQIAPPSYQPVRTLLLRHTAAALAGTDDLAAARAAIAARLAQRLKKTGPGPGPELKGEDRVLAVAASRLQALPSGWKPIQAVSLREQCFGNVYAGLHRMGNPKEKAEASKSFQAALEACPRGRVEYRLAETGVSRLK